MSVELLITSYLAGLLTVLSPCVLPILPVVLAGTSGDRDKKTPLVLIGSLAISVFLFTLLLKGSTALIDVPDSFWLYFSGGLIAFIGFTFIFPSLWEQISLKLKISSASTAVSKRSQTTEGLLKPALLGLSLGPIFTSCSPTYGLILATVLPASFVRGTLYITAYTLGLCTILLLIAVGGRRLTTKLGWLTNPNGNFRRILGIILVVIGLLIATGLIKDVEAWLVGRGYIGTSQVEQYLPE